MSKTEAPVDRWRPTAIMLDDEESFLDSIRRSEHEASVRFLTTTDPHETLRWVEEGRASSLVCDLVIGVPDWDGLDVLEEAYHRRPGLELRLLTSHSLNTAQKSRLSRIGAETYRKSDGLSELFDDLRGSRPQIADDFRVQVDQEAEFALHRKLTSALISDFVAELKQIENSEQKFIVSNDESFSVAELIRDLEEYPLSERGMRYIYLWIGAKQRLRNMGKVV